MFLIAASFIGSAVIRKSYKTTNEHQFKNNNNSTVITLEEDKYADYNYCSEKVANEYKDWRGHFIASEKNTSEKVFLPVSVKDSPVGFAATIPTAFMIEESDFCTRRPDLKAIVYVHTAINNTEKRAITRVTWGRASDKVGVIFVVGLAKNKEEENIIASESLIHRDIVQGNYTDMYQFLVYKNLNAMHWIIKNCNKVSWVIHSDDDVLFDVTKFLSVAGSDINDKYSRKMFCNQICSGTVVRDSSSKWVVSENEYPYKYFPIYCMGNLWFATKETVKRLLDVAPLVKYMWVDDAFVTGLLAEKAEIQRYRIDVPDQYDLKYVGKLYGWRQIDVKRIEYWNNIVSFYTNKIST